MADARSMRPISIAIASGKGGTGKTTVATSLTVALAAAGRSVAYLDCDVEEPNGHIFLKPTITQRWDVSIPVPRVDDRLCNKCGACATACRHGAIIVLPTQVLTFPNLCHGCGACTFACPIDAIQEVPRQTGEVEEGGSSSGPFLQGRLNVGEAMAPPVIHAVLDTAPRDCIRVIDAPPGTSCPVIETIKGADVALLVTEPTPFGLNDLKLAVAMTRALRVPFAVAVNRAEGDDGELYGYCRAEGIPVVLELPKDRTIAQAYSQGDTVAVARPAWATLFVAMYEKLTALVMDTPPVRDAARDLPADPAPRAGTPPSEGIPPGSGSQIPELVLLSGKGGTGKTSIAASFAALAGHAVIADCDVDASDLHLVLAPTPVGHWPFFGGQTARVDPERCVGCGICTERCRFDAIRMREEDETAAVDPVACDGCGLCVDSCPNRAISLHTPPRGEWFVSRTAYGPMVHARLGIAQENSGKLVSLVRKEARALACRDHVPLIISDGSPGVGCPVMASLSGTTLVLLVTEPTLSGQHDFERVAELCRQFSVKAALCINKADINPEITGQIARRAAELGLPVVGTVRYDDAVTTAQQQNRAVVETREGPAAVDIRALWQRVQQELGQCGKAGRSSPRD